MSPLELQLTDPPASGAVVWDDAAGDVVPPDTTPTWTEDQNGQVISLVASADGSSATATPRAPGAGTITITTVDKDGTIVTVKDTFSVAGVAPPDLEPTSGSVTWTPGTPAAGGGTPPGGGTTPPPVVTDPTSGLPLYVEVDPTQAVDPTAWTAVTDVVDPGGEALYTFDADTAGQPPTGVGGNWELYVGTPEAPPAAGGGTPPTS